MKNIEQLVQDPPLRAVRTFEAFARLGTAAAAARELAITPSAVSHQLSLLESHVHTPLTVRSGRNLALTAEGREYYRSIRSAFSVLRAATAQVRDRHAARQVTISVIPLFAMGWLIPHLHEFLSESADLDVNMLYANHRSYPSDAADLSVRFGDGQWQGYRSTRVMSGAMVAVASREYLTRRGPITSANDLLQETLLHDEDRATWGDWFARAGVRNVSAALPGLLLEDGQLTLSATLAGLGCSLMREPLITRELREGALVKLFDATLDDGRDYYLCHRADVELTAGALALKQWLLTRLV
ncbi:LysR family transcriptional regulator [Pigmentiphaga aceris]|uniref:LysR family transcriptional regulator n=1 Tax=Pigmentiphaga aceris TaxID=1940612 RepID=A0A5C0AZK9_9BURK|nr:LysR substrate-binding domain-containing protein [Pigmentiphaga aceris]QEI07044.1 LysR family transcriptional regulator [Pigmentiphaga aceris]